MANFTELKAYIRSYIYENHLNDITGEELQGVLIEMVEKMGDEAINEIAQDIADEITARQNAVSAEAEARALADTTLDQKIYTEEQARIGAVRGLEQAIQTEQSVRSAEILSLNTFLNSGYLFIGVAATNTNPGTPDRNVFYLTADKGTFTNFLDGSSNALSFDTAGLRVLYYVPNSGWQYSNIILIDDKPNANSNALLESGGAYKAIYDSDKYQLDYQKSIETENLYPLAYTDCIRGGLQNGQISARNYRVVTENIFSRDYPFTIYVGTGFKLTVAYYNDNDSYKGAEIVTDKVVVSANQKIRICVLRTTEDTTEVADINEFASAVKLTPYAFPFRNSVENTFIPIKGKVSIIGDSISSCAGKETPAGYNTYYPDVQVGVSSVYDMWWQNVLSLTGSKVEVNASYSGSRVTKMQDTQAPTLYERASAGVIGNPDVIFIALGTGDCYHNAPLGEYDYDSSVQDLSETEFIPAYIKGIKCLMENYPTAKIVLFIFQMDYLYNEAIHNIGEHFGLDIIDTSTYYKHTAPNVHPDKEGMDMIARDICGLCLNKNEVYKADIALNGIKTTIDGIIWSQGGLNPDGSGKSTSKAIRSNFANVEKGTVFNIGNSAYVMSVYKYANGSGSAPTEVTDNLDSYVAQITGIYRIVLSKRNTLVNVSTDEAAVVMFYANTSETIKKVAGLNKDMTYLKDNFSVFQKNNQLFLDVSTLINGRISGGSVVPSPNDNRVVTQNALHIAFPFTISVKDGFVAVVAYYNSSDVYQSAVSVSGGNSTRVIANQYIRIGIQRASEITEIANVYEFAEAVTISPFSEYLKEYSEHLNFNFEHLADEEKHCLALSNLIRGGVQSGQIVTRNYRVVTENIFSYPYQVVAEARTGFKFALVYYNAAGTAVTASYTVTDSIVIPSNQKMRICIMRTTENTSEIADILEFSEGVLITSYGYGELEMLKDAVNGIPNDSINIVFGGVNSSGVISTGGTNNLRTDILNLDKPLEIYLENSTMMAMWFYNNDGTYSGHHSGWLNSPSAIRIEPGMRVVVGMRYADSSDISSLETFVNTNVRCNFKINNSIYNFRQKINKQGKAKVHFSIDDFISWVLFRTDTYKCIYESAVLSKLLYFHLKYGMTVTLNCFLVNGDYNISQVVDDYQSQFGPASDWMKFAFHAKDKDTYYSSDDANLATDYAAFVSAVYTLTGKYDAIDHVTRLGGFTGNLTNVLTLRNAKCGIDGLLTADDDRNSYYLDSTQSAYLRNNLKYFDSTNQITFIHNLRRFEAVDAITNFNTLDTANFMRFLEVWSHESHLDDEGLWDKVVAAYEWLYANGYSNSFAEYELI